MFIFMICGENVREICKKYWKSQGISSDEKSGNPELSEEIYENFQAELVSQFALAF